MMKFSEGVGGKKGMHDAGWRTALTTTTIHTKIETQNDG